MALKGKGKKNSLKGKKKATTNLRERFKKRDNSVLEKTYKERADQSKGNQGKTVWNEDVLKELGIKEFKPSESRDYYFEVMPPSENPYTPYFNELPIHFGVGFSKDAFICMQRFSREPCYRCEAQQKKIRALVDSKVGNEKISYTDEIKSYFPSDRAVYLMWDRSDEIGKDQEPDYSLSVWAAPKTKIHEELQVRARDKRAEMSHDISDVSEDGEGKTVTFELEKKANETWPTYKGVQLLDRDEPIPDEVLENLEAFLEKAESIGYKQHPLEILYHFPAYEEVQSSMKTEEKDDEEESTQTKKKKYNEDDEEDGKDSLDILVEFKEYLTNLSSFRFKKFVKTLDNSEDLLEEDKEDAISEIIEGIHEAVTVDDADINDFLPESFKKTIEMSESEDDDIPF